MDCNLTTNLTSAQTYLTLCEYFFLLEIWFDLHFSPFNSWIRNSIQHLHDCLPVQSRGPSTVNLLWLIITKAVVYDFVYKTLGTLITLTMPDTVPIGQYLFSNPADDPVYFYSTSSTPTTVIGSFLSLSLQMKPALPFPIQALKSLGLSPRRPHKRPYYFRFCLSHGGSFSTTASGTNTTISVSSQYFGIGCTITGESSIDYVPANFVTLTLPSNLLSSSRCKMQLIIWPHQPCPIYWNS